MFPSGPTAGGRSTYWPATGTRHFTSPAAAHADAGHTVRTPRTIRKRLSLRTAGRVPAIARTHNGTLVLGPCQPHVQLVAGELESAALGANRQAGDRRAEVAQVLAQENGSRRGRDRRQRQLRAAYVEPNLLEPAVAERAPCQRREGPLGRVGVGLERRALPADGDPLLAEQGRGGMRELERVHFISGRLVPARLDPRSKRELGHEVAELLCRGRDHSEIPPRRLFEHRLPLERLCEADDRRERSPQVVTGERDEEGKTGVSGSVVGHGGTAAASHTRPPGFAV